MKMFNLIDVGEQAGSGIPSIYYVWKEQGWAEPTITETFPPNRTVLSLPLSPIGDNKSAIIDKNGKPLEKWTYTDLMLQYGLSSPDTVEKACKRALEKMRSNLNSSRE